MTSASPLAGSGEMSPTRISDERVLEMIEMWNASRPSSLADEQISICREMLASREREAALKADAARLDWLLDESRCLVVSLPAASGLGTTDEYILTREEIDAAIVASRREPARAVDFSWSSPDEPSLTVAVSPPEEAEPA